MTIGGILITNLSSIGTDVLMMVHTRSPPLANSALKGLSDQMVTKIVKMTKGDHAFNTWLNEWLSAFNVTSWPGKRNMFLGFQNFRKTVSDIRLTSAEVMSGNSGPMKFEVKNWVTAKVAPQTRIAGHVSRTPRQPSMTMITHKGMMSDSKGSWRPAIAPILKASMPVTCPATRMGMPIAPKATGAVLVIRHRPAA